MNLLVEAVVASLLVASGLLTVVGALGLLRLRDFFQRMHPPALANTLAAWCAALATSGQLSATAETPSASASAARKALRERVSCSTARRY